MRGLRGVGRVHLRPREQPGGAEPRSPAFRPRSCAPRPGCTPAAPNSAIYYGLGVTEHSQGSTMVMGMANLAMATGNIGRDGVGVNPLRGQNNVQGSCDMGSFPHELPGYRHVSDDAVRDGLRDAVGPANWSASRACGSRTCSTPRSTARFRALFIQGEDIAQSDPNTAARDAGAGQHGPGRRAGPVPERDLEVRARVPARDVVPGEGRHVHQRRAPDQPGAPGDDAAQGPEGNGKHEWQIVCEIAQAMGYPMDYPTLERDHGRDRCHDTDFRRGLVRAARPARAASSGRATTRRPRARRSCTWTGSSAGWGGWSRRRTSRPRSAPPGGSR